jgi:hypothetical protein
VAWDAGAYYQVCAGRLGGGALLVTLCFELCTVGMELRSWFVNWKVMVFPFGKEASETV